MSIWETDNLKNLCLIGDGNHSSKYPKKSEMVVEGVPFIRGTNIVNGQLSSNDVLYISQEKHLQLKKGHLKAGDVLFTNRGEIGKVAIVNKEFDGANLNSQIAWLRCRDNLLPKYLYYFLQSKLMRDRFEKEKSGAALQQFPIKMLNATEVYFPSVPEQNSIVALLETVFADLEQTRAKTEQNLKNARELFDSYLQQVFSQKGEGWVEKTLKEASIDFGRGKSKHRPRNDESLYGGDYPFVQTGDVRNCEHLITKYSKTYNEVGLAQSKLWPKGTICITIAANIAETGILDFDSCFPDSVIGVVVNPEVTTVSYVEFLLQSFKAILKAKGKGSAQDNINMGTFEKLYFPFPSINKQKEIVHALNELMISVQKLEAIYEKKFSALDELKKSILQKAFNGELTTTTK